MLTNAGATLNRHLYQLIPIAAETVHGVASISSSSREPTSVFVGSTIDRTFDDGSLTNLRSGRPADEDPPRGMVAKKNNNREERVMQKEAERDKEMRRL